MILLIVCIIVLICIVPISKSIKDKKMNSKILKLFFSVIVIFIIIIGIVFFYYKNSDPQQELFLIFEGGSGEIIYDTKLYWDGDKQNAEYICSKSSTKSWGRSEMKTRITKRGKLQFVQEIFEIVENNKALKSAIINKDVNLPKYNIDYKKGDTLTIEEVYELFNIIGSK